MKKIIIISIALLALTACESKQVEEVKASSNQSYPVEKLFTVNGITVYRFRDNDRYVYFTNRTGDVQYSYQKRVGKATKTIRVQTVCTMSRNLKISEVRAFLASASRQFERENIFLHNVRFKRDEKTGEVIDIIMSYEQKDDEKEGYK